MDNFKGDFSQYLDFLHPQIPDFQIVVYFSQILSYPNNPYIIVKLIYFEISI